MPCKRHGCLCVFDHPTIALWVGWDSERRCCKKIYESPAGQDALQSWLETTFVTVSDAISGLEWCNSDPPVPELPTLFLIWSSPCTEGRLQGDDIVLRARHDITDGAGTLMLFNNLFAHAARAYERGSHYPLPCFGIEYANLSPPFRVAAGLQPSMSPEQRERFESIMAYNAFTKQYRIEVASVPFKRGKCLPGKHQRVAVTLPAQQTTAILTAYACIPCSNCAGGAETSGPARERTPGPIYQLQPDQRAGALLEPVQYFSACSGGLPLCFMQATHC